MVGEKRKKLKRGGSRAVTLSPLQAVWAPSQGHRSPGARDGGGAAGEDGKAQENFARRQGQPAPGRPAVLSAEVPKPEGAECATGSGHEDPARPLPLLQQFTGSPPRQGASIETSVLEQDLLHHSCLLGNFALETFNYTL